MREGAMPDKALLKRNAELQSGLTKLRAEVALTQETLQAARLCTLSTVDLVARMRGALEDIRRRTGPESVLSQSLHGHAAYDDVAELHMIADSALGEAKAVRDQLATQS
jgi:hypothetical protein